MSSYYTTAQLEAMRKARLKQNLAESIQRLKEQLMVKHENTVQITAAANIATTVSVADNAVGGYSKDSVVTGDSLKAEEAQGNVRRAEIDFSGLLVSANKKPTKLEQELDCWVKKIDKRPIVSEKDEKDRTRLLAEIAKIIQTSTMDIEDKIKSVKMRVIPYLQDAVKITDEDREKMEATYFEYCALCEMLEVTPTETLPYRVENEVVRLTALLEKRRQDEYIMEVIENVMESLGCHIKDDAVLDHTAGQIYAVDGHPLCDVFVGNDGSGIMFEPVGESRSGSLERQRQIESSANSICSLYTTLEEMAAEKGVILQRVCAAPAYLDEMVVQSDISERKSGKRQRRTSAQKQQSLNAEG